MSNTLIDKLSKMERDSIIKNDSRVAQSIFNLTKKSKEKEDNNLKFVQIKGLSAPSEYQFKKLFNDLYTDITDAESAFVSGQQTQEKTYGLIILKKYNLLCQYITRVLKYNSMTQSNKDEINNTMDTILPHLNNILSVIDIGYATLSAQYGEPVFNDIPIYKNIKENIQSRIYSQISRETMKYEIDNDAGIERYYYEDEPDVDDLDDDEGEPPQDVFLRQPPDFDYENFEYDEPERLVRDENYDAVQFEEPMELNYGNYEEPERLLFEDYEEEEEPQELQIEREPYPVQRYIDYDQGESFPIQYAEQNEEYDDNYEQRADKQRERNLLKKTVSDLKKRAKQKLGAKENLKLVSDELKKLGNNYKLKKLRDNIKESLNEEERLRGRQRSAEYIEQKKKEKEKEKDALNKITNFLKRGIRNRKKKDIKEPELDELDKALAGEMELDDLDINELNNKAKQRAINRLKTISNMTKKEKKKTNDTVKRLLMKDNKKINKKNMADILINKWKNIEDSMKKQENKEERRMTDIIREEQQKRIKEQTPRRPPPKEPKPPKTAITDDSDYYELQNISEQMDKMPNTLKKRIIKEITDMGMANKQKTLTNKTLTKNILNDLLTKKNKERILKEVKLKLKPVSLPNRELNIEELKKQILGEKLRKEMMGERNIIERLREGTEQREMKRQEDIDMVAELMKNIERRIKPAVREPVRRITTRGRPPIQLRIEEKKEEKEQKEPYIKGYQKKPENIKRAKELRKIRESKKVKITNPNQWTRFVKKWGPMARGRTLAEKSPELQRMYKRWKDGDEKYDF